MLPVIFIIAVVIIIAFISFSVIKKKSGEEMGEHNNDLPPH